VQRKRQKIQKAGDQTRQQSMDKVEEALGESFSASDPSSWTAVERVGPPLRKSKQR
jgi:hypothetical protein